MPKQNKKFKQDPSTTIGSFSKNLLGLKFMQRAKKEVEKVAEQKDEVSSFDTSLCNKLKSKQQYIINPSYQFCERLRFGRFSFKGMNTYIETIMSENSTSETKQPQQKRSAPPSEDSSDNEIDNLESDNTEEDDEEELDILEQI